MELKKRRLEESYDSLSEELAKLQAQGRTMCKESHFFVVSKCGIIKVQQGYHRILCKSPGGKNNQMTLDPQK